MRIGVPKEIAPTERRVALTPDAAGRLTKGGFEVLIERGAKQRTVRLLSHGRRSPKPVKEFMTCQKRIDPALRMVFTATVHLICHRNNMRYARRPMCRARAGDEVSRRRDIRRDAIAPGCRVSSKQARLPHPQGLPSKVPKGRNRRLRQS